MSGIAKYLARYAEPEVTLLPDFSCHYDFTLVVPAYQEQADQIEAIWQLIPHETRFLVILVINSPAAPDESANSLMQDVIRGKSITPMGDRLTLALSESGPDLLIVDRFSEGLNIPSSQGVGLARKIGTDIALHLHEAGVIGSKWLFTTDADAILPGDYFDVALDEREAAIVFPFRHSVPHNVQISAAPSLALAVSLYEIQMLYYAAGLGVAGSPYGYPTVGSTICARAASYAAVRGFPKRNTGEDFYLLNKLRKLGDVRPALAAPIILQGRLSTRVPVGTGRAVARIADMDDPLENYRYEHPDCFSGLRSLLVFLQELSIDQPAEVWHPDPIILNYCDDVGISAKYLAKRKEQPSPAVMNKFLTDWFDGLRTRQFIHHLRDHHFGTAPLAAISDTSWIGIIWRGEQSIDDIRARLAEVLYRRAPNTPI